MAIFLDLYIILGRRESFGGGKKEESVLVGRHGKEESGMQYCN